MREELFESPYLHYPQYMPGTKIRISINLLMKSSFALGLLGTSSAFLLLIIKAKAIKVWRQGAVRALPWDYEFVPLSRQRVR